MATRQQGSGSRGDLMDAAWQVAQQYRAYEALARRCRGCTEGRYEIAFRQAVALYDAAVVLVAANAEALWEQTDFAKSLFPDFARLIGKLRRRCPGFRADTYRAALSWI